MKFRREPPGNLQADWFDKLKVTVKKKICSIFPTVDVDLLCLRDDGGGRQRHNTQQLML